MYYLPMLNEEKAIILEKIDHWLSTLILTDLVHSSAAETRLDSLFVNVKEGRNIWLILEKFDHQLSALNLSDLVYLSAS